MAILRAATEGWEEGEVEAFAALLERFAGAATPRGGPGPRT
jgi:hypothetical protein